MAKGKGRRRTPPSDEQAIAAEITRQFRDRRQRPAALFDPKRFEQEYRVRRIAINAVAAHPRVKLALDMAERLRFIALRADAVLNFHGDPVTPRFRTVELALAPSMRELARLCAPHEGTPERQRDKLIDLVEWAASEFEASPHTDENWKEIISIFRFELSGTFPVASRNVSDEDLGRAISVFLPPRLRPDWEGLKPKWEQLADLVQAGRIGKFDSETIRTEYIKHKSKRRKLEEAEEAELRTLPLGNKIDDAGLTGAVRERVAEQIRAMEALALARIGRKKTTD